MPYWAGTRSQIDNIIVQTVWNKSAVLRFSNSIYFYYILWV